MTEEQAIKIIRRYECNKEHYEACEMAIKTLEEHKNLYNKGFVDGFVDGIKTSEAHQELCEKLQQKTGYWIKTPNGFKCSRCLIVHRCYSIYCPSCGTKMIASPERSE